MTANSLQIPRSIHRARVVHRKLLVLACSAMALWQVVTIVGASAEQLRGQALDIVTGAPVADVHVLALYEGAGNPIAHSIAGCSRIEYQKTGADGTFQFSVDREGPPLVTAYKSGYVGVRRPNLVVPRSKVINGIEQIRYYVVPRDLVKDAEAMSFYSTYQAALHAAGEDNAYFKPFAGMPAERAEDLWRYVTSTTCVNAGGTRKNAVPFYEAIYSELSDVAVNQRGRDYLRALATTIEQEKTAR